MRLKDLGNSISIINEGKQLGSMLLLSADATNVLKKSFEGLSASQILAKTSTMGLTEEQKLELIELYATDAANYTTVESLAALSASEGVATGTTINLSTALKGLWATLMANPLILVGAVIAAAVTALNVYRNSVEKVRQATADATSELKSSTQSIDEYAEKYKALHDELTNANTTEERQAEIKKELFSLQTELNEKYGDEYTIEIAKVILETIQRKGYCTEKEIAHILGGQYRYEVTETQIKRSLNEIMDSYGLKKVKANQVMKEKYKIDSDGYPNTIVENVTSV